MNLFLRVIVAIIQAITTKRICEVYGRGNSILPYLCKENYYKTLMTASLHIRLNLFGQARLNEFIRAGPPE